MVCEIVRGNYDYLHFALPCASWANAARRNGGSRRKTLPWGLGLSVKEVEANQLARVVILCCWLQHMSGGLYSVENPSTSNFFDLASVQHLAEITNGYYVVFDQCMYGLKFSDCLKHEFCKKRIAVLSNCRELTGLERYCCGISPTHQHKHAWGSIRTDDGWIKRTVEAGNYPLELCHTWASLIAAALLKSDAQKKKAHKK